MRASRLSLVTLALAVACSKSSETSDDEGAPPRLGGAAAAYVAEVCALYAPCCAGGGTADPAACGAYYQSFAPELEFFPTDAEACLASLRADQGKPELCATPPPSRSTCESAFRASGSPPFGSRGPGEPCESRRDCRPDPAGTVACAVTLDEGEAPVGVCQLRAPGKEGDGPCVATLFGQDEIETGPANEGTPPPPRGIVCAAASGLFCGATGTCAKLPKAGERCDDAAAACEAAAYCNLDTQVCGPRAPLGGDCAGPLYDACAPNAYCDASEKCASTRPDGAACESGDACTSKRCIEGTCRDRNAAEPDPLLCGLL